MFNIENELILLKAWASGNHTEDMAIFEPKTFYYSKLFEIIRGGTTLGELGAILGKGEFEDIKVSDLFGVDGSRAFYYGARGDALNAQREYYIEKLRTDADNEAKWLNKVTEMTNLIRSEDNSGCCANFAETFFNEREDRLKERNPHYGKNFGQLDKITRGLHRGELITVCARPSCGKSVFGLQVANQARKEGYKVMYLPLEMSEYQTFQRLVVHDDVTDEIGCIDDTERPMSERAEADIRAYLNKIEADGDFRIYYGLSRLSDIEKRIKEEQPYLVIIDQLTHVEPIGKAKDIRDKYMQITDKLKKIALADNVCILALHQLNRGAEDKKIPGLADLAESDSVGRDSDVVLILNNVERDNPHFAELIDIDLIIAKNRQGHAGDILTLELNGSRATFYPFEGKRKQSKPAREI